ncbi:amidohydrolase family protein [Sporosalibacterium faouarense]|uniref:amidohydrolase family protein n=1 Tax=Sporosalibacterium faouarense TaxID=516123 RepID=UPI00141C3C2D|nr:TatD family hydrolase [Sporosalibacterium faouarense]MTI47382.1 amidohydrolase [Bacillota bacterium]
MKIIDAHLHFSDIASFHKTALDISNIDYSSKGLKKEFEESNIILGIGMGLTEKEREGFPDSLSNNPMNLDLEQDIPKSLVYCLGINPERLKGEEKELQIQEIKNKLEDERVVGLKIYAGYYPYYVYDKIYHPIYKLAAEHDLPVVIHTGDTYSERGLLKYSHPLAIDELAVRFRNVNFVMAHFGDPWIMDAAEIILKNSNVYADLSGLLVGDAKQVDRFMNEPLFVDHIKRGLVYTDNYFKFMFGTDWPLVQINPYIEFVKKLVPKEFHDYVFYKNAIKIFPRIKNILPLEK